MLKKAARTSDDLFEKSSMSFGEHLEELRKALVKAFLWLGIGTAVGMFFAESLVAYITVPMQNALKEFNIAKIRMYYKEANNSEPSDEFVGFMAQQEVVPKLAFIDPREFHRLLPSLQVAATPTISTDTDVKTESAEHSDQANVSLNSEVPLISKLEPDKVMWKDVNVEMLSRLRPIRIWQSMKNDLIAYSALEGFMIWLKAGLVAGAVIASPGIFWHIWEFLAAGLYPHERRYVYWYLPLSIVLFLGGVCLAFFAIFQLVLGFLLTYNLGMGVDIEPRLNEYISFALFMPLGFGIAFQLPLVMLALNRFGIISQEMFISKWRIAVLAIAFASMVLTPAEPFTMLGMFIPLTLLYFLGIFLCKFMPRGPGVGSQALDPQG